MVWYTSLGFFVWDLFLDWLRTIFIVPFQNVDMLWLLVPIWLTWFFAEFFQEKTGTSMGNAITNAVIIVWASIDCTRQTVSLIASKSISGFLNLVTRFGLIGVLFVYGMLIVVLGIKGNKIIKKIGRIREVTYVFAMFVPIFYNAISLTWEHILAAIIFFPLFYGVIELIDKIVPNPKAINQDSDDAKGDEGFKEESVPNYDNDESFNDQDFKL